MVRGRTRATFLVSSVGILAIVVVGAMSGIAEAVSGGGYNSNQQDCPWNASAWNMPQNEVYPGCHDAALNVETGGQTNGDPNSTNTRFVEVGLDQEPVDANSQGTPTILSLAYPGNSGEPHAGCVAVNTDGTGGGPAPAGTAPEAPSRADDGPYGCGNNPAGTGFEANYNTYALFCPILAAIAATTGTVSVPDGPGSSDQLAPCEDASYSSQPATFTPDTGGAQALSEILTQGLIVYFGMDDNFDNGEHDGFDGCSPNSTNPNSCLGTNQPCATGQTFCNPAQTSSGDQTSTGTDGAINGPSDGGAIMLSIEPQWLLAPSAPTATHPEGLANASEGECADGICGGVTTQQQTVYYGCVDSTNPQTSTWTANGVDGATSPQNNTASDQCTSGAPESTNAYQNSSPASTSESANCNSGGPYGGPNGTESPCFENANGSANPGGANAYRSGTAQQVNTEPGVQTYQDPDPQRSPAAPFATPGLYVGTCGVYLNDSGGYGEPGVTGFVLGSTASTTNPLDNQPLDDPGYVVETPSSPGC
jgi:hypothetical protein